MIVWLMSWWVVTWWPALTIWTPKRREKIPSGAPLLFMRAPDGQWNEMRWYLDALDERGRVRDARAGVLFFGEYNLVDKFTPIILIMYIQIWFCHGLHEWKPKNTVILQDEGYKKTVLRCATENRGGGAHTFRAKNSPYSTGYNIVSTCKRLFACKTGGKV